MCKPSVRKIANPNDGPCSFSIRSHSDACAAFSLGETWRSKLANVLRRWADKAEGVQSFVLIPHGPPQITFSDAADAAVFGFNGATKYLNDLWRERVFGSTDKEARPVVPNGRVR